MVEEEKKWFNWDMQTWFFILGLVALWFVGSKDLDPSQPALYLSLAFIAFPLILLGVFAIPSTRKKLKKFYEKERINISNDIEEIRKKERNIKDINKLIKLDEEIVELRRGLLAFRDNIFEKRVFWALVFFILTIISIFLNLGLYIDVPNNLVITFLFIIGTYHIFAMLGDLFEVFRE